jgi:cytidylate kinase
MSKHAAEQMNPVPVVTIDGPSGAGKGAVSARCAAALGFHMLDSGAVYRSVAVAAMDRGIEASDIPGLVDLCSDIRLEFVHSDSGTSVHLDGRPVDDQLRREEVSAMSSKIAVQPDVRAALLELQRGYRRPPGLVADGRDMGTIVFPDAPVKIFLDASVHERATRRYKQLKDKGESVTFSRLFQDLEERDRRDRERAVAPTVPAADAIMVDSTNLSLDEVVERVLEITRSGLKMSPKEQ